MWRWSCKCQVQNRVADHAGGVDSDTVSIASSVTGAADRQYGSLVVAKPDDRHIISFNPDKPGIYELHVSYDGFPVPDSPLVVEVVDLNSVQLTGQGLSSAPIFSVAWFRIELLRGPSQQLSITVTNPRGNHIDCTLTRLSEGLMCEWTPDFVGVYHLQVFLGDRELNNEAFKCHVYDISKVKVTHYDKDGMCGQRMRFEVKSEGASGDGKSEIAAFVLPLNEWKAAQEAGLDLLTGDEVGLPLDVGQRGSELRGEFVPTEGQQHVIEIFFNEQPLPQCPIMVHVLSELDVLNQMPLPSMQWVPVGVECNLCFVARFEKFALPLNDDRLTVTVRSPSGDVVTHRTASNKNEFTVYFTPQEAGAHSLEASYAGQPIRWSPLKVNAYDADRLRITFEPKVTVARVATVTVDFASAGDAPLQLKVTPPSGSHLAVQESFPEPGTAQLDYVPAEIGVHQLVLLFNGIEVEGCPFQQMAQSAEMAVAHGEGLVEAQVNRSAEFFVDPKGQMGELLVQVDGPTSVTACDVHPMESGLYSVRYTPSEVGRYSVLVKWNSESIPGSPFAPLVVDPSSIRCVAGGPPTGSSQLQNLVVGKERTIVFDTSRAGPGRLSASVDGPHEPLQCHQRGDSISFTPQAAGQHVVRIWFGDQPVPGTPFRGSAVPFLAEMDHSKVVLNGRGLREARIKEEAHFLIDGSQAGPGQPSVSLVDTESGVSIKVRMHRVGEEKFRCSYTATQSGIYQLNVAWAQRPLKGSPYRVVVIGQSDANRVVCSGEGLRQGILGREISAVIDTRRAGEGDLEVQCQGPTKQAACNIRSSGSGTFSLLVEPQEAGMHSLMIMFSGDHVPGSPFSLRVSPPPDASSVRVLGPGVEHGVLSSFRSDFVCETRGAGAGELVVRVRGPRGAFQVEMEREYQKDRTINCRYEPTEAGEYQIIVKWSGEHVPGSPFRVMIFESNQELDQHVRLHSAQRPSSYRNGSGSSINF